MKLTVGIAEAIVATAAALAPARVASAHIHTRESVKSKRVKAALFEAS